HHKEPRYGIKSRRGEKTFKFFYEYCPKPSHTPASFEVSFKKISSKDSFCGVSSSNPALLSTAILERSSTLSIPPLTRTSKVRTPSIRSTPSTPLTADNLSLRPEIFSLTLIRYF